jgi:AcrR family transcriptional regulator
MILDVPKSFKARKTPMQARSVGTVEAIAEATVQVLLSHGADRLTTTRVAERAGVSVGTLYQYYPNKQSLLFALLEDHLDKVASAVEAACTRARGRTLMELARDVVEAFVDAKLARTDISTALYRIAAQVGGPTLVAGTQRRLKGTVMEAFRTAPDAVLPREAFTIQMLMATMAGTTRSVLEAGTPPGMATDLREHLVRLCQAYLAAVADPVPPTTYRHWMPCLGIDDGSEMKRQTGSGHR